MFNIPIDIFLKEYHWDKCVIKIMCFHIISKIPTKVLDAPYEWLVEEKYFLNIFLFLLDGSLGICRFSPWIPEGWLVQMVNDQKMEKCSCFVEIYFEYAVNTCQSYSCEHTKCSA